MPSPAREASRKAPSECGDSSPLSTPGELSPGPPCERCALPCSTATSRLDKAVTGHRTPNSCHPCQSRNPRLKKFLLPFRLSPLFAYFVCFAVFHPSQCPFVSLWLKPFLQASHFRHCHFPPLSLFRISGFGFRIFSPLTADKGKNCSPQVSTIKTQGRR